MIVTSKDNPRVKQLAKLYSNRKYRRETGLFVIEGVRGCVDAVCDCVEKNGLIRIAAVYHTEDALAGQERALQALERLEESKRYIITPEIAERISDTDSSQGIFVVAERLDKPFSAESLKAGGRYLILDELQDPGNLGTMIRTSDAVGLDGVVLTGDCVDLYNPKVVRSAVGSMPRVDIFVEKDRRSVFNAFRERGIRTAAAVIEGGTEIKSFDFSGGCAVAIGNEGRGLSRESEELCTDRVSIAMHGHIDSLNAAAAATIFLWEMTRREG